MFMDKAQSHPGETKPGERGPDERGPDERGSRDSDLRWTEWALVMLREMAEIDMRSKRLAAQHQAATLAGPGLPDFPLMQSRLSRSLRLTIAMTERIRADYLLRRDRRQASGEQQRRRRRREQAPDLVAEAVAQPGDAGDAERVRSLVREDLVEDEILDVQIDTLSPQEFVRAVCRKIGLPPDPSWVPRGWDDGGEARAETGGTAEAWPRPANDSAADQPMPGPPKPDSS